MQRFKVEDADETKFIDAGTPTFETVGLQKDEFFDGAYECHKLGEIIFDNDLSPLSNAIPREIFREAFKEIFEAFIAGGTFEAYLTVFAKIFGEDADVTFTVPAPGKLEIDIAADGVELTNFIARYIENNAYVRDNVVTQADEQIIFQTIKGFQSQYELEQMLFEMVPSGIFTTITLTLGT